jgi:glutathione reductase (NADPH)
LGLENVNVEVKNGAIVVNEYSQTSEDNIYAVGDCTDKINLTPVAINEGRAFADTVFGNKPRLMSYENVPSAVFSTPEAATVGLTELQAKKQYGDTGIKVYRSKFRPGYNVLPDREDKTLMKLVVHQESGKILGAHMVGRSRRRNYSRSSHCRKNGCNKSRF